MSPRFSCWSSVSAKETAVDLVELRQDSYWDGACDAGRAHCLIVQRAVLVCDGGGIKAGGEVFALKYY